MCKIIGHFQEILNKAGFLVNYRKRVIDFMGHACRQPADRGKLVGLLSLDKELLTFFI